ncbi:hypothetical protein B0T18DRAFT_394362 [Schizothecium vesticola]|uniref:Heterokaryon incompatibility domain-containing protein n=1 Tax=Schizothecium vesticola TaxID=314040 RepID=A0AA40BPM0_9PEZI|nr:hypothetical protein B0T18DRAFT_394362 [Schizothecium vesticola]
MENIFSFVFPRKGAQLCVSCQKPFSKDWQAQSTSQPSTARGKLYAFHGTLKEIRNCDKTTSCPLCKLVASQGNWENASDLTSMAFVQIPGKDALFIHITAADSSFEKDGLVIPMHLVDETELRYFIKPKLRDSTFTHASRSFIKAKMSHCYKIHTLCRTATSGDFVPTRLLDTRASPASVVKLVRGSKKNLKYATLSHCWGKTQIIQLKKAVEGTFTGNGIPVDSLPPTFQQAVISALMASVYGRAVVNIAASSSSDSRGGLFYNRDPLVVQPFAARSRNLPGVPDGWYLWKNDHRWSALSIQPLNRRGWVLQERLLSARTIHFSDTELVWHCLEDMASESVPLQVNYGTATQLAVPIMQVGDYTDMRVAMAAVQRDGLTDDNKVKLYRERKRVLAHYTQCGLTNGGDKLIAIAGIVDRLEALSGDRCYAGLWRSEMPGCLVWLPEWGTDELDVELLRQQGIPKEPVE